MPALMHTERGACLAATVFMLAMSVAGLGGPRITATEGARNVVAPKGTASEPATTEAVIEALGVRDRPVDYVFLLDVSKSMEAEHRFRDAVRVLDRIAKAARPQDRISVVMFGDRPTIAVERKPQALAFETIHAAIPGLSPAADRSDIGRGLDQGLRLLEGRGDFTTGVLMLLSDGVVDAAPDSPYADPRGATPAWATLRRRVQELNRGSVAGSARTLQAVSFALRPSDESNRLVQAISPGAPEFWPATPTEVVSHLAQVRQDKVVLAARSLLGSPRAPAVQVEWPELDQITSLGSPLRTHLVLQVPASRVPWQVRGLEVSVDGVPAEVHLDGTVTELTARNGDLVQVPVTITLGEGSGRPTMVPCKLSVTAEVDTTWREGMRDLLGADADAPRGVHESRMISCRRGSAQYWIGPASLAALVVAAILGGCWLFWRYPLIRCKLTWSWKGGEMSRIVHGRCQLLPTKSPVRGFRVRGRRTGWGAVNMIEIAETEPGGWGPLRWHRRCTDWRTGTPGEEIHIEDVVFTFTWTGTGRAATPDRDTGTPGPDLGAWPDRSVVELPEDADHDPGSGR